MGYDSSVGRQDGTTTPTSGAAAHIAPVDVGLSPATTLANPSDRVRIPNKLSAAPPGSAGVGGKGVA